MHRHHHHRWGRHGCRSESSHEEHVRDEPRGGGEFFFSFGRGDDELGAPGLGVRRPLRFLSSRLDLTEDQVAAVARTLERLKIERAQAEVEVRRSAAAIADAIAQDTFDAAATQVATEHRADSAKTVQAAVARALGELHAALEPDQRKRLAMLIRTRAITF